MKKKLYLGVMLILILALVTAVFAFGPRFDDEGLFIGEPDFCGHPGPGVGGPIMFGEKPEKPGSFRSGPGPILLGEIGPARFLNLSREQLSKMREMADRSFQGNRGLRYELLQKELEMRMLLSDPKADEATLLTKQKELSALHQKLMDKIAQVMIAQRKILTPEQIQKLDRIPMGHGRMGFGMMD